LDSLKEDLAQTTSEKNRFSQSLTELTALKQQEEESANTKISELESNNKDLQQSIADLNIQLAASIREKDEISRQFTETKKENERDIKELKDKNEEIEKKLAETTENFHRVNQINIELQVKFFFHFIFFF
jgi:SMC interacting uncharacterized protein involved in chromosome segregation